MFIPEIHICKRFAGNNEVILFDALIGEMTFEGFLTKEDALKYVPDLYKQQLKSDLNKREIKANDRYCDAQRANNRRAMQISNVRISMMNYFVDHYFGHEYFTTQAHR